MQQTLVLQQKIRGLIQIFRPELPLAAGICVFIGQMLVLGAFPPLREALQGLALGIFLSGAALVFNDYFDLEVDRVNAPNRPLPAGLLSSSEAIAFGVIVTLLGLAAAAWFGPVVLGLSLLTWLVGFLYNWKFKAAGLWGNLMVSLSVAMTFLIGGLSVGDPANLTVWGFGLVAFLFDLAEEIAADAMDAEGDAKRGSKSIAIQYGKPFALHLAAVLLGLVVVISLLPLLLGRASLAYLLAIPPTVAAILYFTVQLLKSQTREAGRRAIRALYLSASLGLVVFLVISFLMGLSFDHSISMFVKLT